MKFKFHLDTFGLGIKNITYKFKHLQLAFGLFLLKMLTLPTLLVKTEWGLVACVLVFIPSCSIVCR